MRALVTGVSGFVGRHLLAHLQDEGDDASGCDRADGSVDILVPETIEAVLRQRRPEVVYHLAGWADVGGSWDEPMAALRANAEGTLNVLSACRVAGVERVLVVSSADIYGLVEESELPLREDSPLRPASPYAASKVAADYLALQAWLGYSQHVVRARAFNHLGPGQTARFAAAAFAERVARAEMEGHDELAVGNLEARRDYTDVRDVVRAYRCLIEAGTPGEAYNVCSGTDVRMSDLLQQFMAGSTRPLRAVVDPTLVRPVDLPVLRGDNSLLRAATGWHAEIPLATTLADVLADARARVRAGADSGGSAP